MIFNMMNYGGGGSVEDAYAIIRVTYPVGSDCTCTKDETGGMVLEAADKTGIAMFAVPESGRWGVACTNGTSTASEFVNATTRLGIYEVTLSYEPSPGPTPTPTETKIVASGYMVGAINATELNGDWNGGDVVIGTSAEWVVPNTGTYVVMYVPGDSSGAKTYFVNVTTVGNTYALNLQTGTVEEITPDPDPEPASTTVLTVTFPAGSISLATTSRVPVDSASGSNGTNTKTFNLDTGSTYIVTYSGTNGSYKEKTITASGETMSLSFIEEDSSTLNVINLSGMTGPTFYAGSGRTAETVTEWVSPTRTGDTPYAASWDGAYMTFGEYAVVKAEVEGQSTRYKENIKLNLNQETNALFI